MESLQKRTWAEISLRNIEHNYRAMRQRLPEGCRFLAVVKTDAYGHGAEKVAPFVERLGADYLAATSIDDASAMRSWGVKVPILIFGRTDPQYTEDLIRLGITQEVDNAADAMAFSDRALDLGKKLKVHLKLDSGMGRLGFACKGQEAEILPVLGLPGLEFEGVFTHFAVADAEEDGGYTDRQLADFLAAVEELEEISGVKFAIKHCANSAAVVHYPKAALDMVRPGLALYGLYPDGPHRGLELRPAMELKTRVAAVKYIEDGESVSYGRAFVAEGRRRVAVVPIGYGDGLHRALSGKMEMLLHGRRVPQIGRICMDMCMLDVTDVPCEVGDVVTVFGRDGDSFLPVEELAAKAGTISYEMTCGLTHRVPRLYVE